MGTISKVNDILCVNISKIDDILKANAYKLDDNVFCPVSPTPTPTPSTTPSGVSPTPTSTPPVTPTPSPTPCSEICCEVELCFGGDCVEACSCNTTATFYLHIPCYTGGCTLGSADGIFEDSRCSSRAGEAYYSDGQECYYWDGITLTYQGDC